MTDNHPRTKASDRTVAVHVHVYRQNPDFPIVDVCRFCGARGALGERFTPDEHGNHNPEAAARAEASYAKPEEHSPRFKGHLDGETPAERRVRIIAADAKELERIIREDERLTIVNRTTLTDYRDGVTAGRALAANEIREKLRGRLTGGVATLDVEDIEEVTTVG